MRCATTAPRFEFRDGDRARVHRAPRSDRRDGTTYLENPAVADVVATVRLSGLFDPYGTVPIFLTCTASLLVLLLAVLASGIHQIWRYRQ